MMNVLIPMLSMVVICWNVTAKEIHCTKIDAKKAEISASRLNSWKNVYKSFKKFRHCDDGAIAEGYSDSVARLLAEQWHKLRILIRFTSSDKDFYKFVLGHIDATADQSEIKKIIINSSQHCPESAKAICSAIEEAARTAMRDFKRFGG